MTDLLNTPDLGTGALEHRDRVDFAELRQLRLERVLQAMDEHDLDVCLLGREANVRYATGARRLWTASTRPFAPTCAIVRATGRARMLSFSASYEGMPAELGTDEFFAVTWNPMRFVEQVLAAPGVTDARRVGVDGMTPMFQALLRGALPAAELVGVEPMLRAVRRRKLPGEIDALRIAAAVADAAMASAARVVAPGVSERAVQAEFLDRLCVLGTSQFAQQGTFTVVPPEGPIRWITGDHTIADGDLVAMSAGALWAGYEGTVARTWRAGDSAPTAGQRELWRRWRRTVDAVIGACRAGRTGADLRAAHEAAAEPLPPMSIAYSVGLGHEGAIAGSPLGAGHDARQQIEAGMVLAVRTQVTSDAGSYFGEDMVLVTDDAPERLTVLADGPLAATPAR